MQYMYYLMQVKKYQFTFFLTWVDLDSINSPRVALEQEIVSTSSLCYCFLLKEAISKEININLEKWSSDISVMNMISIMMTAPFIKRKEVFLESNFKNPLSCSKFRVMSWLSAICSLCVCVWMHTLWLPGLKRLVVKINLNLQNLRFKAIVFTFFPLRKKEDWTSL